MMNLHPQPGTILLEMILEMALFFMSGTFFYKTNSTIWATIVPNSLVIPSCVEGSRCAYFKAYFAAGSTFSVADAATLAAKEP